MLGSRVVGPDHLLLCLLSEIDGLPVRLLLEQSVDVRALRRRLTERRVEPSAVSEMVFDPALTGIFQAAGAIDGEDPHPGVLLKCLLHQVSYPEISKAQLLPTLDRRLLGNLPDDPCAITLDGLRLGMTEQRVLECLGPPGFRKESCWMYRDTSVQWREGRVEGLLGKRVEFADGWLELGCHWLEAEPVLGALRLRNGGPGPLSALVSGDRVRILTLSLETAGQDD
ncbi:MAG: Clp protease N-terminal domain-containing protein [Candidatus Eremiobacteraeota bacterium]|nr:Clp protease N-terminal domain-containing protein [Candidatus Eremiobacteraeota bacterium]